MGTAENKQSLLIEAKKLVDIHDVTVHADLPKQARILDFIRQIGNPYCYRHGKYTVRVSFADTGVTLEERLSTYVADKAASSTEHA